MGAALELLVSATNLGKMKASSKSTRVAGRNDTRVDFGGVLLSTAVIFSLSLSIVE